MDVLAQNSSDIQRWNLYWKQRQNRESPEHKHGRTPGIRMAARIPEFM